MAVTTPTIPFTEERLDNGLRLILSEDHLAPVVAVNLWYDVGSRHEQQGRTGLAHLFEHMMFQGSRNVAKGEHFSTMEGVGGVLNATTWLHRTNYFEWAPSHALETMLWLEADRMGGLLDALGQETLDNQRDVVKNERRQRYDNQPYGLWTELMFARLFPEGHPYHHTTIGSMDDLSAASLEDVRDFFRTYYAPNNAVLTIVGDFEPEQARAWVRRYFGGIPSNPAIPTPKDPAIALGLGGEVRHVQEDRVPLPRVYAGYRSPAVGTREADAVTMASTLLAGLSSTQPVASKGSRLYRRLVRDLGLAQDAQMMQWEFPGVSVALGWATAKPGVAVEEVEQAFHAVVEGVASEDIPEEELARARASAERAMIDQYFVTVAGRADWLSENATILGDPRKANERLGALLSITPEEIKEAARTVFRPENRVVLTFVPAKEGA